MIKLPENRAFCSSGNGTGPLVAVSLTSGSVRGICGRWSGGLWLIAFVVCPIIGLAQMDRALPLAQAMSNTYNLYGDKFTGTCFMLTRNGQQYFVTAAHLFESSHKSGEEVTVQLVVQNEPQSYQAKIYYHPDRKVDIAVLKFSETISQNASIPDELSKYKDTITKVFRGVGFSTDSIWVTVGSETYFLGYPLGNLGTELFGIKFPLLKKAIISGFVKHNGVDVLLLDGHNNLGFSGGPVIAYDVPSKQMRIVGVISGYLPEPINVRQKNSMASVEENSGIIVCYDMHYIMEIFRKNALR
jgi:hypothetical protein